MKKAIESLTIAPTYPIRNIQSLNTKIKIFLASGVVMGFPQAPSQDPAANIDSPPQEMATALPGILKLTGREEKFSGKFEITCYPSRSH
jgi:hypothetical protein